MKKSVIQYSISALLIAATAGCNNDRAGRNDSVDMAKQQNDSTAHVIETDANFAVKAADAIMTENELISMGEESLTDQRLKAISETLRGDTEQINDELLNISSQKMISLPPVVGEDKQERIRNLREESRERFDQAYINAIIDQHRELLNLYDDASKDVRDSDLQAHAAKHVPVLNRNLEQLQALRDSLGYNTEMEMDQRRVIPVTTP